MEPLVLVDARRGHSPDFERATRALTRVCSTALGAEVEVGFVKKLGSGLSRDAWCAGVEGPASLDVFALVPNLSADADYAMRARRELGLLSALGRLDLAFRVPRLFGGFQDADGLILVEERLTGFPLELRAGRSGGEPPWTVVGRVAAHVHRVSLEALPRELLAARDCLAAAKEALADIGTGHPLLKSAKAWMKAHLPPREPGVLLHGDLLGQNVLLGFDGPPGLIDWERAEVGDPAAELAIVTRGTRKPFQTAGGLELLLDAYAAAGGRRLSPERVWFYELSLLSRQLEAELRDQHDVLGAENRLESMLHRIGAD